MITRANIATGEAFLVPDRNVRRKVYLITSELGKR